MNSHQNFFHRVTSQTPTRFWINNVTRNEAVLALGEGAVGCTQNPSYVYKMLTHEVDSAYAMEKLGVLMDSGYSDVDQIQEVLQQQLVGEIAKAFLPQWEQSQGRLGYVSVQGDPFKEDVGTIVASARFNREAGPNIMAKIPATKEGLEAIELLLTEGVPINATEVMGVRQAMDICDVYDKIIGKVKNPPPLYISHITGIYDEYLQNYVKEKQIEVSKDSLWQAGMIIAKKVHKLVKDRHSAIGFIGGGARGLHHFTEMIGAECNITINWKGTAEDLIKLDPPVIDRFNAPVDDAVLDELLEKVDEFSKGWFINGLNPDEYDHFGPVVLFRTSFEKSWDQARSLIQKQMDRRQ
ncbi:MAG: transaldolase family protein [Sphaerochaeta sp.]|nr:transaldolase family protein [Sphaerochaeta sp.]